MEPDVTQGRVRARGSQEIPRPPNLLAVGVLVVIAGVVPALWNLALLNGVEHSTAFDVVYLLLSLVPLGVGFGTAGLRRRPHVWASVLLAVAAAGVEAFVEGFVLTHVTAGGATLVLAADDVLSWLATALLFGAGALSGQRRLEKRSGLRRGSPADTRTLDVVRVTIASVGLVIQLYRLSTGQ